MVWKECLAWLARMIIGLLLLTSGYTHISNPYQFLQSIYGYQLVGDWLGILIAAFLPFLHLSLGVALLMRPQLRRPAFATSAALLATYTIAQTLALGRGLRISCGCFSSYQTGPIGYPSIAIAASACALSIVGLWSSRKTGVPAG
jgi:hypothetical protein